MTRGRESSLESAMGEVLADVIADLPRRRLAVRADVLARVVEELERRQERDGETSTYGYLPDRPDNQVVEAMERHFISHTAEMVSVLVNIAMARGAGIPGDGAAAEEAPAQPPATCESLGGAL